MAKIAGMFDRVGSKSRGPKKVCILTGASSGLGLATTKELIATGEWKVIMAVRDVEKAQRIADEEEFPKGTYEIQELELGDFDSVRAFIKKWKGKTIDCLLCNAAIYLPNQMKASWTADGIEESCQVNHLSHFMICNGLIDEVAKSKWKRMIIVGSITGNTNTVGGGAVLPFADLGKLKGLQKIANEGGKKKVKMMDNGEFNGAKAYKDAKLANMMTVIELHRRYNQSTGITFTSMYPGCIADTPLFRQKRGWFRWFFPIFMKYVTGGYVGIDEAGERLRACVTDPETAKSGVYWSWNGGARSVGKYDGAAKEVRGAGGAGGELFENAPSDAVRDPVMGAMLWDLSAEVCGIKPKAAGPPPKERTFMMDKKEVTRA